MPKPEEKWVAIWGNAVSIAAHRPESYAKNITLRYPVDVPFSGNAVRFTFDNYCGNEDIRIARATLSFAASDSNPYKDLACPVQEETIADIHFQGNTDVLIPARQQVVSDPVPYQIPAGCTLCVSIFLDDFTLMQSAVRITGPLSKGFFSFGDQTHSASLPIDQTKTTNWFFFLSNVDLYTANENRAVVCYGDSITAQDWPDEFKLLLRKGESRNTSVIRRAASGTRVLREYSCITYDSYGLKGTNRFHHEIPTAGADIVIIQQGINDIIHPVGLENNIFRPMSDLPTAEELIDGLRWYCSEAKKMGLTVYLGTLLPIFGWRTYAGFREALRCQVNEWIRTTHSADGCIDFDAAVRDSLDPVRFAEGFDSGDHLHPSSAAYRRMAEAVSDALSRSSD